MGVAYPLPHYRHVHEPPMRRLISIDSNGRVSTIITAQDLSVATRRGDDVRVCDVSANGSMFTAYRVLELAG